MSSIQRRRTRRLSENCKAQCDIVLSSSCEKGQLAGCCLDMPSVCHQPSSPVNQGWRHKQQQLIIQWCDIPLVAAARVHEVCRCNKNRCDTKHCLCLNGDLLCSDLCQYLKCWHWWIWFQRGGGVQIQHWVTLLFCLALLQHFVSKWFFSVACLQSCPCFRKFWQVSFMVCVCVWHFLFWKKNY